MTKMEKTYVCIAADVKDSRHFENNHIVNALEACANHLNEQFAEGIVTPFNVRNGDELVGVLEQFTFGYEAVKIMIDTLSKKDIYLYIGVGFGELSDTRATVHTMNGSAVLNAFEARDHFLKDNHAKAKQWYVDAKKTTVYFYAHGYPYQGLNALVFSIMEKREGRSRKQNDVIELVEQYPDWNYEKIGQELGYKSPKSTVSYLLSRADYQVVNAMEDSLRELLNYLQKPINKEEP